MELMKTMCPGCIHRDQIICRQDNHSSWYYCVANGYYIDTQQDTTSFCLMFTPEFVFKRRLEID